ncbi:signal peptidase I [Candidatus Brocadiaceae bacterium B188]|nr:signal peptidase I [Candidatus Brocadiaceae bacterium B188]
MRCKVADIKEKQAITRGKEGEKKKKGKLRENIESIIIAVAVAFAIRYFVVEAFKIPTGSMAPTLLGEHKNVKCPNCGWFFYADRQSENAQCPNCQFEIRLSAYCDICGSRIRYNWPAWLWRKGYCQKCQVAVSWPDLANRIIHGGNRIVVNKFWYKFKDPQRWDVVVFIYPLYDLTCKNCSTQLPDTEWHEGIRCPRCGLTKFSKQKKNYIKRLVGLPGEKLQIVNGDLYINDKIQRKPAPVQETLWLPVYDSNYLAKEEDAPVWITDGDAWQTHDKSITLDTLSRANSNASLATFGRSISDQNGYNSRTGHTEMGDTKISFDVTLLKGSQLLTLVLEKNNDIFTALIPADNADKKTRLLRNGTIVVEKDIGLQTGHSHKIEFSNVDRMVSLAIDNKEIFAFDYDDGMVPDQRSFETSKICFGGTRIHATFENIKIFHDLYYTSLSSGTWGTTKPVQLGEKDYFMLGDNSRNSNDSRVWKFVPKKNIVGKAFFVFWPLNTIKFIK